ncbi:hypothetical protein Tco_0318075 [Tanacetum coccineum]
MTTLKFADTHNMVAFLAKPAESEGFEQIAKTVNGEVQLQALVDGKKIIITESIVRRDLQLEDAEGVDCLPNATIFEQLTLMGYEKISQKLTFYKAFFSPQWKFLIHTILQCLSSKTTAWNECSSTMASAIICLVYQLTSLTPFQRSQKRKDTEIPQFSGPTNNVADEAVYEEMDESLERAVTTATSLDAEQDRGNMNKTQSKATLNEPSSLRTSSGSGPRCQETMRDTIAQTRSENVSKHSNDQLLARGNTLRSGEDSRKLQELRELCITLQLRVLALETTKTTQAMEITSLKRRVKKLDRMNMFKGTIGLKDYKGWYNLEENPLNEKGWVKRMNPNKDDSDINADAGITFEKQEVVDEEVTVVIIPVSDAITTTTTTAITDVEMTLAQALVELKSAKPKANKVVIQEPEQGTTTPTLTTTTDAIIITAVSTRPRAKGIVIHEQEQVPTPTDSSQQPSQVKVQDKGKGKMVEPEPVKKISKKELLRLDEELAFKLQAKEKEERLAKEKYQQVEDANIAWDDVQAKIDVDYQLAQRLQAQEQEELTDEKKGKIQKLEEDKESKELKQCLEIIPNDRDDVTIDATPLSTKSPTIVDYKIYKEGKKSYLNYQSRWRIVGIKILLDDLRVIVAKLMLLVYKLLLPVLKVNAASTKVTTAQRLRLLKEFLLLKEG